MLKKETKVSKRNNKKRDIDLKSKFSKFYNSFFKNMSSLRQIFIWYLVISLIGSLLLFLPISQNEGQSINFLDALFISSSSFSDTGLSTKGISKTFNWFGQLIILILVNVGGVGFFTIKIFILTYILRKRLTYSDISDVSSEVGTSNKNETLGLVFSSIIISLSSSIIFGFIFSFIFYWGALPSGAIIGDGYGPSLWAGLFHASSSINNAGFDIFNGDTSMAVLGNGGSAITIQAFTLCLSIIGGIGFGVAYDIYLYIKSKTTGQTFSFSLVTKISVVSYATIAMVGLGLVYMSEGIEIATNKGGSFLINGDNNTGTNIFYNIWALTFNTFSTRNLGFSTMELSATNTATQMIQGIMMFIGSGPGSTAGGLRTTTLFVLVISAWSFIRNKKSTNIFKRSIPIDIVRNSFRILVISLNLIVFSVISIYIAQRLGSNSVDLKDIIFLTLSAYGTTGLSLFSLSGEALEIYSKILLILVMFIGQVGVLVMVSQFKLKENKIQKEYPEEYVNLG